MSDSFLDTGYPLVHSNLLFNLSANDNDNNWFFLFLFSHNITHVLFCVISACDKMLSFFKDNDLYFRICLFQNNFKLIAINRSQMLHANQSLAQ